MEYVGLEPIFGGRVAWYKVAPPLLLPIHGENANAIYIGHEPNWEQKVITEHAVIIRRFHDKRSI